MRRRSSPARPSRSGRQIASRAPGRDVPRYWYDGDVQYQALYRKYRPQRFDQVVGQEHVTRTLLKEIAEGRVAHAYLFAGPRGTGKTTTARLLAKALNCPDRSPSGEPCNDCVSCQSVAASSSLDVIELDAASHNKVEDIRDLRSGVSTVASVGGARRVFILDEAHMLTKAAGNALLKTLEEPPEGVHFVLATTEPYRLLDTIRSRSQRFDFHLVSTDCLLKHLEEVSAAEGFRTTTEGLTAVARRAAGSVRDALSLLEQAAAADGTVTEDGLSQALGVAGREAFRTLVKAISDQDAGAALGLVSDLAAAGADMRRFAADSIEFFRGVFLAQYAPAAAAETGHAPEAAEDWAQAAEVLPRAVVRRALEQLGEVLTALREGREERITVELALLKLTRPELDDDPAALISRIERLERGRPAPSPSVPTAAGPATVPAPAPPSPAPVAPEAAPAPAAPPEETVAPPAPEEPTGELSLAALERIWPQLVAAVRDRMGPRREALFRDASPHRVENGTVYLTVPSEFFLKTLENDEDLKAFAKERVAALLGTEAGLAFELSGGSPSPVAPPPTESPPAKSSPPSSSPAPVEPSPVVRPAPEEPSPATRSAPVSPQSNSESAPAPAAKPLTTEQLIKEFGAVEVKED